MAKIHVLPTDQPSKLRIGNNGNFVIGLTQNATVSKNDSYTNQHIYITSDEEIKDGDWVYHKILKSVFKIDLREVTQEYIDEKINILKIILTKDPYLIADGIQALDDTFLQWFVQNPSCEEVETTTYHVY